MPRFRVPRAARSRQEDKLHAEEIEVSALKWLVEKGVAPWTEESRRPAAQGFYAVEHPEVAEVGVRGGDQDARWWLESGGGCRVTGRRLLRSGSRSVQSGSSVAVSGQRLDSRGSTPALQDGRIELFARVDPENAFATRSTALVGDLLEAIRAPAYPNDHVLNDLCNATSAAGGAAAGCALRASPRALRRRRHRKPPARLSDGSLPSCRSTFLRSSGSQ